MYYIGVYIAINLIYVFFKLYLNKMSKKFDREYLCFYLLYTEVYYKDDNYFINLDKFKYWEFSVYRY